MDAEVGGVSGIWVPGEGKQPREAQGKLHVSALEVKYGYSTGGTRTNVMMQSMWDTHTSGATDETQVDV